MDGYQDEPGADRIESDHQRVTERHLFANGWGLEVTAFTEHGLTHLTGTAQVVTPRIKGNRLVWSEDFPEDVPENPYIGGARGAASWSSIPDLGRIIEAVREFPEYEHECSHEHCY